MDPRSLQFFSPQGSDWASQLQRLLDFDGGHESLGRRMQSLWPIIVSGLLQTPAGEAMSDPQRLFDLMMGPAAATMQQGTTGALTGMSGQMAQRGLTAGGMFPAMEAGLRTQTAGQMGGLQSQNMLQALQTAFGTQRDVAGMGMGMQPVAGGAGGGTDWSGLAGAGGQLLAAVLPLIFSGGGGGGGLKTTSVDGGGIF